MTYRYFSRYCAAWCKRNLAQRGERFSPEEGEQLYAETIAFFRDCMLKNPGDRVAVILRARMYAELGQYYKAEEIASALPAPERNELMKYIGKCRDENGPAGR